MEVKFCYHCGASLTPGSRFCGRCGTAVYTEAAPAPEAEPAAVPAAVAVESAAQPVPRSEPEVIEEPSEGAQQPTRQSPPQIVYEPVSQRVCQPEPRSAQHPVYQNGQESAPAEPMYESTPSKKALRYGKRGVGRTILAVLVCMVMFVLSFATVAVVSARRAVSGENLQSNVMAVIDSMDLAQMPVKDLISGTKASDGTVYEWIADRIVQANDGNVDVDAEDVEEFLAESTMLEAVGEQVSGFMQDVFAGTNDFELDTDTIRKIVSRDADLMRRTFGLEMNDSDITILVEEIEDSGIAEVLVAKNLRKEAPAVYYSIRYGLSYWVVGVLCVLVAALMALLGSINRWNMIRTARDTGITMTVVGALFVIPAMFPLLVTGFLSAAEGGTVIAAVVQYVLVNFRLPCLCTLGFGVFLIVISCICNAIGKLIAKKKA